MIPTDSPIYQKAFEQYLRKGTPIELSLTRMMKAAETSASHTTTHYIWRTAGDDKVRPSHAANDGKIIAWDNPPATGNPGEDFNCRCKAEAYVPEPGLDGVYPELLLVPGGFFVRRIGSIILERVLRRNEQPVKPTRSNEESTVDILKPNGQPIGREGMRPKVRIVKGGEKEAKELFEKLTKDGIPEKRAGYYGIGKRLPNGDWIGYRGVSKSGSPTIDIDAKGINFNKLHFYE